MQRTELIFSSSRDSGQLRSTVRVSKPHKDYNSLVLRRISVLALWDTGAVGSAISRAAAEKLGLRVRERTRLGTAAGVLSTFNDIVLLDMFIADSVIPVRAAVVNTIPGENIDFLIGMDVIQCGDLSIATDHTKGVFKVCFKPYQGLFRSIAEICTYANQMHIIDF